MKDLFIVILFVLSFIRGYAQAPDGHHAEYKHVYALDSDGNRVQKNSYPRIYVVVTTTSFLGNAMEWVMCNYYDNFSSQQNSNKFNWAGLKNGWYVYTYRSYGGNYNYLLISKDLSTVRIKDSFHNGITHVYELCDPNEELNNAPTY